jgi:hypothetical protein
MNAVRLTLLFIKARVLPSDEKKEALNNSIAFEDQR